MSVGEGVVLRIVATFDIDGASKAQNVFHAVQNTGTAQDDEDVVDAALNWIEDIFGTMTALTSDEVSLEKVEVYEDSVAGFLPVGSAAGTWAGTSANDRVPAGVAILLHAQKSRTNHTDKKYIAGTTEATIAGDTFTSTATTAAGLAAAEWIDTHTDANGVVLNPVSYNRNTKITKAYTGYSVSDVASYQRRRKPGVGLT